MKAVLKIISTPGEQTHSSIAFTFDKATFIFNTGEGAQRIIQQNKFKLSKLKAIFLSRVDWSTIGGLPGMLLTATDSSKVTELELIGPLNLINFLSANQPFLARPELKLSITETCSDKIIFQDDNMTVKSYTALNGSNIEFKPKGDESLHKTIKKQKILQEMFSFASKNLVEKQFENASISYVCEFGLMPRKMDPKKAAALGVVAQDRARIVRGESVMTVNGMVHPDDCLHDQLPPSTVIILDCPGLDYIDSILNNNQLMKSCFSTPKCIVHQLGVGVIKNPKYQDFISKIPSQQIILAKEVNNGDKVFYNSAELLEKLTDIDEMFKINHISKENNFDYKFGKNVHLGTNQTEFTIDPKQNLQEILKSPTKSLLIPGFLDALTAEKSKYEPSNTYTEIPQVITLGTGSCMPSKYRNVTSNFIKLPKANMFLDIGEGSINQLFFKFGDEFNNELFKTRFIFISHLHADHHLGTFGVIQAWMKLSNSLKLFLAAPKPFWKWVVDYSEIENIGLENLVYIDNIDLIDSRSNGMEVIDSKIDENIIDMLETMGLKSVITVPVEHCYLSSGIVVETLEGFKLTYSGDCRPSKQLALTGQNSDLLIHEATFKDDLKEEAMMKNHSTISEAIEVGKEMNAKNILLTHFSQKYPIIPELVLDQFRDDKMVVGVAFDMMRVKMCDFWKFRYILPVLDKYLLKDGDI